MATAIAPCVPHGSASAGDLSSELAQSNRRWRQALREAQETLDSKRVERREEILVRAEGNPYFLEQLVAHMAAGGSGVLPDTLHALLAARVDTLPVAEKRLLQAAAVVGRVFWVAPLRDRLGYDIADIADPLAALENRGLILTRQRSSLAGQVEFAFNHALLHDVAYASLPVAQRARGHAEVAEWLEAVSQDRVGEVMELVAYHYSAAADGWDAVASEPGEAELITANAFRSLISHFRGAPPTATRRPTTVGRVCPTVGVESPLSFRRHAGAKLVGGSRADIVRVLDG